MWYFASMPQFPHCKWWIIIIYELLRVAERIKYIFITQRECWVVPAHSQPSKGLAPVQEG